MHSVPAHGQSSPPALKASDVRKIQTIDEVVLSPSGRNVAYVVHRAAASESTAQADRSHLYVVPSTGRDDPHLLTRSARGATQPAWHPDGDQIAFVRPVDGTPQVFILSLSGGEPYQLTDFAHGATDPSWSPNGDRLLFSSALPAAALHHRSTRRHPSPRPARAPRDTVRRGTSETVLVLRRERTFEPVDTLTLDADGRLRLPADTGRTLRPPTDVAVSDSLPSLRLDSLRALSSDSLRTVFRRLRLLPDTTTVSVPPDTAAAPDGDLLQRRRWLAQQSSRTAQVHTRSAALNAPDRSSQVSYQHYFVVDVPEGIDTRTPPRPQPRPVTTGYRSFQSSTWLPGGSQILVSAPSPRPDTLDAPAKNLYLVDVGSSLTQRLLQIDGYSLSSPTLTDDGSTVAFRARPLAAPSYEHNEIGLFELDGRSSPTLITTKLDRNVQTARWSPDGWYLYVTANTGGGRSLYRFAPFAQDDTSAAAPARGRTSLQDEFKTSRDTFVLDSSMVDPTAYDRGTAPNRFVRAVDVTDSKVVYAMATPKNPSELYANTVSFNNEKRLSAHNTNWTRRRYFPTSQRVSAWNDGFRVPGRLTLPSSHKDTSQTPLAVLLRGGPPPLAASSYRSAWTERQYLVEQGYGVLEVWPRGSEGFGEAYKRHNFQDWGSGPASDVIALTDSVLARHWANTPPQVLAGRAYGGTLAAWLVAHTDRFDAAAAQSGVYALDAFYGESKTGTLLLDQFGGPPWSEALPAQSPVLRPRPLLNTGLLPPLDTTQSPKTALRRSAPLSKAHQIDTPLLLMHGATDSVVSPTQTERLYRRLEALNTPVEYVRYPRAGHSLRTASPLQRMDRLVRLSEFFARYVSR